MAEGRRRPGVTLPEILLGVVILALSFLPIIGVMGSSIKGTQKDEEIVKAVHLAQTSLNTALQFPFNELVLKKYPSPGAGPWSFTPTAASQTIRTTVGDLVFAYGETPQGRTSYNVSLTITDERPSFVVPIYDPQLKSLNATSPVNWGWGPQTLGPFPGVYHRYDLVVTWKDGMGGNRFYTLVSFKAKLME